jgi:excisionase family DNA binding protein
MQSAYMTVTEVADALEISTSGVYKLIDRGKLPAIRRSERGLRVSRLALDAYQRRLRGGAYVPSIQIASTTLEEARAEFEHETHLSPTEWEQRWKAEQIEDSAENMGLAIRALSLLLRERGELERGKDPHVERTPSHRSAA